MAKYLPNSSESADSERCLDQVRNLRDLLDGLKRKPGKLGVTVRETLKEISVVN